MDAGIIQNALKSNGYPVDWVSYISNSNYQVYWLSGATQTQITNGNSLAASIVSGNAVTKGNWTQFLGLMIADSGFVRIQSILLSSLANIIAGNIQLILNVRLAMVLSETYDTTMFKTMWNAMINAIPVLNKPTSTEIAQWNAIAVSSNLSYYIVFNSSTGLVN